MSSQSKKGETKEKNVSGTSKPNAATIDRKLPPANSTPVGTILPPGNSMLVGTISPPGNSTPVGTDFFPPQLDSTVEVVEGNNAMISWNFPQQERLPNFEISWWTDETDRRCDQTSSTNYMMAKLKYGAKYLVNVTLVSSSAGGVSRTSNVVHFDTAPHAPSNVKVVNYPPSPEDSIVVSFDDNNEKEVKHEVTVEDLGGENDPIQRETENKSVLIRGLTAGTMYHVSVVTTGMDGKNLRSKTVAYELPVITYPPIPANATVKLDDERLIFKWQRPNNRPDAYEVHWTADGKKHSSDISDESFSVEKLASSTTYRFKVAAINSAGRGDFSEEAKYTTAPAAPVNVCVRKNAFSPERSFIVTFEDQDPGEKLYEATAVTMEGLVKAAVKTTSKTAVLNDLEPGNVYYIHVIAIFGELRSKRAYFVDHKK